MLSVTMLHIGLSVLAMAEGSVSKASFTDTGTGACKPNCDAVATGPSENLYNDTENRCNRKEHIVACSSSDKKLQTSIHDGVLSERWTDGRVYQSDRASLLHGRDCFPFFAFKTGIVVTGYPWNKDNVQETRRRGTRTRRRFLPAVRPGFLASNGLYTMFTSAAVRSWKIVDTSGQWATPQTEDDKKYALETVCQKSSTETWKATFWTQTQELTLKVGESEHTMAVQNELEVRCGAMEKYTFCEALPSGTNKCKVWKQCAPPIVKVKQSVAFAKTTTGGYDMKAPLLNGGWGEAKKINYHSTSGHPYLSQPALETSAIFMQTSSAPCRTRCAWY